MVTSSGDASFHPSRDWHPKPILLEQTFQCQLLGMWQMHLHSHRWSLSPPGKERELRGEQWPAREVVRSSGCFGTEDMAKVLDTD